MDAGNNASSLACRKYAAAPGKKIHWPGGREEPPPDIPPCGFLGNSPDCDGKGKHSCKASTD